MIDVQLVGIIAIDTERTSMFVISWFDQKRLVNDVNRADYIQCTSVPDRTEGADHGTVLEHATRFLMPVTVEPALDLASRNN